MDILETSKKCNKCHEKINFIYFGLNEQEELIVKNNKNLIESVVETNSQWTNVYRKIDMPYPSEYVIRIFKGTYPRLNLRGGGILEKVY